MSFCDKLDFLMKITNTKNSILARYVTIDASYISRMRRGDRAMPNNPELIESMAEYFSKKSKDDYIKSAVLSNMNMNSDTSISEETLKELILNWLTHNDSVGQSGTVNNILSSISNMTHGVISANNSKDNDIVVYYGTEGKRQATLSLLNMALADKTVRELLLFSDENPELMLDNPSFSKTWTELITKLVARGVHINVIHKISRDINEMLHVINQWLPLYLTGNVDPYYYPHLRDGVYKRTLYVASGLAAVSSSSIGNISDGTANMLVTDSKLVNTFTNEFYTYLSLCRPMLRILKNSSIIGALLNTLKESAGLTVFSAGLSHITIPVSLHKRLSLEHEQLDELPSSDLEAYLMAVGPYLEKYEITSIGYIYEADEVRSGRVKIPLSNILYGKDIYYTTEEYRLQLLNLIYFLENYPSFNFLLMDSLPFPDIEIYVSMNSDAFIIQCSLQSALKIEEDSMRSAFYHYITNIKNINTAITRQETIEKLRKVADELKQSEVKNDTDI
jgi:hypothetical protein